jgi:ankyrin repeat protein
MSFGLGQPTGFGGSLQPASIQQDEIDSSTPWVAASDGNLPMLQTALAQLNLGVTASDENGYTLLQAAASYSQIAVMQWLLAQNSLLIHAVDGEGDSALHYASTEIACRILVDANIDSNVRNQSGRTALETKMEELNELIQEEDYEETDEDAMELRRVVSFLTSLHDASCI